MQTYRFKNKTTGTEWDKFMKIAELDDYVKENDCTIQVSAPQIISGTGEQRLKTDEGFKDRMREIKKHAGKGTPDNPVTIGDSI